MAVCRVIMLLLVYLITGSTSQPEGWKMTDRFYGFRYQVKGNTDLVVQIVEYADKLGCFGWIQRSTIGFYVGEARCLKRNGAYFEETIRSLHHGSEEELVIKIYEDTKIRLHFSNFKVLDEDRDTCFLDEPHKCSDLILGPGNEASNASTQRSSEADEL